MCDSISSINSWFHEPIVLPKESCKLAILTTLALLAIGFATYCYFYGIGPVYNHIYAYCLWGLTGGAVICILVAYIAKAILSREFARVQQEETIRRQETAKEAAMQRKEEARERYNYIFERFFPDSSVENLPVFSTNLLGSTGYFDEDKALQPFFVNGCNIIRAQQAERPFLGIRLAIHGNHGSKKSTTLLIAPNPNRLWYVHASPSISQHISSRLSEDSPESRVFIDWIISILNGQERSLLQQDASWKLNSPKSYLIEKMDGPKVSLWQD